MRRFFTLCLLAFVVVQTQAQTSVWKVSNGDNELYLAGSVHILKKSDYPLPQEFDVAFENSEKVVFETDIAKLNDPQMAQTLMAYAMLPDNKTLKDVLSEEVYNELDEYTSKMSIPLANLARFKPSMVMVTMTGLQMQKMGITSDGVDQYYYDKASESGKELGFLESVERQLKVLTGMGEGNEDAFIKYSLADMDNMEGSLNEMITTWRDGTSTTMKDQLSEMKEMYPEIYKSLMVDRNNDWMPQIVEFLEDNTTEFVVVGSLHLHGPEGLIDMLEAKGYEVEQLKL